MKQIPSFSVNHLKLKPGLYVSRVDSIGDNFITTFDLRITEPNKEPVLNTAEMHTIEHIGATYLRNHTDFNNNIVYFGPMGCRTGFYLILKGNYEATNTNIQELLIKMFQYISTFEGKVPGASAIECGNYLDINLPMAKYITNKYLATLKNLTEENLIYSI